MWLVFALVAVVVVVVMCLREKKVVGLVVTDLFIYPIKSCAGVRLDKARFDRLGFENDRRWMVVQAETNEDGVHSFVTARQKSKLVLIQPELVVDEESPEGGVSLRLTTRGREAVEVPSLAVLQERKQCRTVRAHIFNKEMDVAMIELEEVTQWLNEFLDDGSDVRLVTVLPNHDRTLSPKYDRFERQDGVQAALVDGFPFMLLSEESVSEVQRLCPQRGVTVRNFRPNIVLRGAVQPFDEETWQHVRIGSGAEFYCTKPCARCTIPTVDPDTGVRHKSIEPLKTLRRHRSKPLNEMGEDGQCYMGMCLIQKHYPDVVKVGDEVSVLARW